MVLCATTALAYPPRFRGGPPQDQGFRGGPSQDQGFRGGLSQDQGFRGGPSQDQRDQFSQLRGFRRGRPTINQEQDQVSYGMNTEIQGTRYQPSGSLDTRQTTYEQFQQNYNRQYGSEFQTPPQDRYQRYQPGYYMDMNLGTQGTGNQPWFDATNTRYNMDGQQTGLQRGFRSRGRTSQLEPAGQNTEYGNYPQVRIHIHIFIIPSTCII